MTNPAVILYDANGKALSVQNGVMLPAGTPGLISAGVDDSGVVRFTRMDASGNVQVALAGQLSSNNSTSTPLGSNATFTGTADDVSDFGAIVVNVYTDVASATNGLSLEWSSNGTNWDHTQTYTVAAATATVYNLAIRARYFRIRYTNGAGAQTTLRLQAIYSYSDPNQTSMTAQVTGSDGGQVAADRVSPALRVSGDRIPVFHENWWQLNVDDWTSGTGGTGSATAVNSKLTLSATAASSYGSAFSATRMGPSGSSFPLELRFSARFANNSSNSGKNALGFMGWGLRPGGFSYTNPMDTAIGFVFDNNGFNGGAIWTSSTIQHSVPFTVAADDNWHQYRLVWARDYVLFYVDDMVTPAGEIRIQTSANMVIPQDVMPLMFMPITGTGFTGTHSMEVSPLTLERPTMSGTVSGAIRVAEVGSRITLVSYRAATAIITGSASLQNLLTLENPSASNRNLYVKRIKIQGQCASSSTTHFSYRVSRTTALPSGGTTLTNVKMALGAPTGQGVARQAPTATAATGDLWAGMPGLVITAAGASNPVELVCLDDENEVSDLMLSPGQAVLVRAEANTTNWRHTVSIHWTEGWGPTQNF